MSAPFETFSQSPRDAAPGTSGATPSQAAPENARDSAREPSRESSRGPWRRAWIALGRASGARAAFVVLAVAAALAFLAPLLPLASPVRIDLERALEAPNARALLAGGFEPEYWELNALDRTLVRARRALFGDLQLASLCGTDAKGRDVLARLVWGSRVSFLAAACAALTSLVLGVGWGALAGWAGGRTDNALMRVVDALQSLPFVFLVIFVITLAAAWRTELDAAGISREALFYVLVGAVSWLSMARVVRGQVLTLRSAPFVEAARALGASPLRILRTHVLPNVLPIVVVYLTLSVPSILLTEAFLSFLGLGIEPPKVSWGLLAADGADAINPLRVPWWLVVFPALAMGITLLCLNRLGDGLRDALDPHLSREDRA